MKFFPAVSFGGVEALNLIGNVYGDLKFMPTGGINYSNMKEFLSCPYVIATGGIWMATRQMINEGAVSYTHLLKIVSLLESIWTRMM